MKKNLLIEKMKKEAIECVETLSTHGLPNLMRTKYIFIKLMWLLLTILSAGFSVFFILKTLAEYAEYHVTTEVRLINPEEPLEFPTISICNKNRFTTNYSIELLTDLLKENFNLSFADLLHHSDQNRTFLIKYFFEKNESKYLFSNIEINEREKYGLSLKDALHYCQFDNKDCNHLDFEWFFNSKYGNCYRFNSNGLKKVKSDQDNGLVLVFVSKNPKEIDALGFQNGLVISIDSKNLDTYSDFENKIQISTGFETNIKLEKSLFQKYPKPFSNCDFLDESIDSLTPDQQNLYNEIVKSNLSYSYSLCEVFCRHKLYYQKFSCKFRANSLTVPNVKYCPPSKNLSYLFNEANYRQNATDSCIKTCPIECQTIKYNTDISIVRYGKMYYDFIKHEFEKVNHEIYDINTFKPDDLLILRIFYGSLNYMSYKESRSMTLFDLISNLGGTLGLFLGK